MTEWLADLPPSISCGADGVAAGQDHTFSVVGFDPATGALGVAVATARLAVGNRVPFVEYGVGAIATQANTHVALGYDGLRELRAGKTAQAALAAILSRDTGKETRQVSMIDAKGNGAAFTGEQAEECKGHIVGKYCIAAGNMLAAENTLAEMVDAFSMHSGSLADKLMAALEAGQRAGGDKRGKISAALSVVVDHGHPYLDLRVDRSSDPVADLRILYEEYKSTMLSLARR